MSTIQVSDFYRSAKEVVECNAANRDARWKMHAETMHQTFLDVEVAKSQPT